MYGSISTLMMELKQFRLNPGEAAVPCIRTIKTDNLCETPWNTTSFVGGSCVVSGGWFAIELFRMGELCGWCDRKESWGGIFYLFLFFMALHPQKGRVWLLTNCFSSASTVVNWEQYIPKLQFSLVGAFERNIYQWNKHEKFVSL